jgi:hypothetical protein
VEPVAFNKIAGRNLLIELRGRMEGHEQIRLLIPAEVERLMEQRGILREDVQRTIHNAETTGAKFNNSSTGHCLTSYRPDRVTYWVEYSRVGEEYQVYAAYSHRMEMKRGRG